MPTTHAKQRVTWAELVMFARQLEHDADRHDVNPEAGSRLVHLLLQFHDQLTEPVLAPKPDSR